MTGNEFTEFTVHTVCSIKADRINIIFIHAKVSLVRILANSKHDVTFH